MTRISEKSPLYGFKPHAPLFAGNTRPAGRLENLSGDRATVSAEGPEALQTGGFASLLAGLQGWGGQGLAAGEGAVSANTIGGGIESLAKSASGGVGAQGIAGERQQLEQSFNQSISKLESAPKKAREKMEPGMVENVKARRDESLRAHDQATEAEKKAQETTAQVGELGDVASGGAEMEKSGCKGGRPNDPLAGKLVSLTGGLDKAGKGPTEGGCEIPEPPASSVNESSSMPELKSAFSGRADYGRMLDQHFQGLRGRHRRQADRQDGLGRKVDGLDSVGEAYGAKEQAHGAKETAFKKSGESMMKAAQGLGQAAQIMSQMAQMLNGVAQAVMAIPFVGPALAASIKKVAMVISMVGKGLQMVGQMLGQAGSRKMVEGAMEGLNKDYNKGKGVETRAGQAQAKSALDESKEEMAKHQQHDNELSRRRAENLAELRRIADLIKRKGGEASTEGEREGLKRPGSSEGKGQREGGKGIKVAVGPVAIGKAAPAPDATAAPAASAPSQAPTRKENAVAGGQPAPSAAPVGVPAGGALGRGGQGERRDGQSDRLARVQQREGGDGAENQAQGGADKALESELRGLAERVKSSREGGGQGMERRGDQRKLAQLYNDAAARASTVGREVDMLVRQEMKDAPERLLGGLTHSEDAASGFAGGSARAQGLPLGTGAQGLPGHVQNMGRNAAGLGSIAARFSPMSGRIA